MSVCTNRIIIALVTICTTYSILPHTPQKGPHFFTSHTWSCSRFTLYFIESLTVFCTCISLMTNDCEWFLAHTLTIYLFSLVECLFRVLSICLSSFSLLSWMSLHILNIHLLSHIHCIFSFPSVASLLIFSVFEQQFLILKSNSLFIYF